MACDCDSSASAAGTAAGRLPTLGRAPPVPLGLLVVAALAFWLHSRGAGWPLAVLEALGIELVLSFALVTIALVAWTVAERRRNARRRD